MDYYLESDYMKDSILFVSNEKLPKWTEEAKKDYEIITKKNASNAFKEVFQSLPDIIILNITGSFFEAYHFTKLMDCYEETAKLPIVITGDNKVPSGIDFSASAQISDDLEYTEINNILQSAIEMNSLSKTEKSNVLNTKISSKQIQEQTKQILDELLLNSSIVEEFKSLIDSMNFTDVLSDNIFKIINNYISYDVSGVFFNDSEESSRNVFNISLPNKNIKLETIDEVRDKFFDEMENYKRINEIQCNLINGDIADESKLKLKSFKTIVTVPYKFSEKLTGGFFFASIKELDLYETAFLNIIIKELEVVYKLKYLFNEQINHALIDPMTGLFNKQEFEVNLDREFHRARRYIFNFTLAMLDIDYFSKINEQYGKNYGDFVLQELSKILKEVFRRTDLIYRYGGEEIIVLLPSTPITKSIIPIERLRERISNHTFEKDGNKTNITVSIGLCANYSKFTEPEQLLEGVGTALVRAKEGGRNKVDIYE